jgi:hypothetical protein
MFIVYTGKSAIEKSVIENEFSSHGIYFYVAEDFDPVLGNQVFNFHVNGKDLEGSIDILKELHIRNELAEDFDTDNLNDLYKAVKMNQRKRADKESDNLAIQIVNRIKRNILSIIFSLLSGLIYFDFINLSRNQKIKVIILSIAVVATVILFFIENYLLRDADNK